MFPFEISSSYFDPEISIPEISSAAGFATTCSDSSLPKKLSCYFARSTCQRQNFSLPEKILYYIAKNPTNGKSFQKLVETCKYFFALNPVIVVFRLICNNDKWYARYGVDGEYRAGFKYDQPLNCKIWVIYEFACVSADASKVIPLIYKNDATVVDLQSVSLKFDEFVFFAGNAEELLMWSQRVKYENDEDVKFEDIVKNVPKLKSLTFEPCSDGYDVNSNTVRKLMDIEHFKNISKLDLYNVSEAAFDVEEMFNFILEHRNVSVYLCYRHDISDAYKELVEQYSIRLGKEEGCNSRIKFYGINYGTLNELQAPAFEDESSDASFENFDNSDDDTDVSSDVDDDGDDLLFPWKNEEDDEWELPWDIKE